MEPGDPGDRVTLAMCAAAVGDHASLNRLIKAGALVGLLHHISSSNVGGKHCWTNSKQKVEKRSLKYLESCRVYGKQVTFQNN